MSSSTVQRIAALGSSFAAGPGIKPVADKAAMRSARNYPHLLAERLGAALTDLTVWGATTDTILHSPQQRGLRRFPPQLAQLPADVDLVTITAGGVDLGYIGTMIALSYRWWLSGRAITRPIASLVARGGVPKATPADLRRTSGSLATIVDRVRHRAPNARVLLVDYLTVLAPDLSHSPSAPFTPAIRDAFCDLADGLSEAFADAAKVADVELLAMSSRSRDHAVGSASPWVRGFSPAQPASSFHPTVDGMHAVAQAIIELLER